MGVGVWSVMTCTPCACRFLALGPGTQLADLMGTKGPKKGGMKGTKSKSGPVKELNGLHTDGRPMRLSVQVHECLCLCSWCWGYWTCINLSSLTSV
jgi:hypothetical protein